MSRAPSIKEAEAAFSAQLQTFKNTIGSYATLLGVTPAQVTTQAADADYFSYVLICQGIMRAAAQQWTSWKDIVRNGGSAPPTGIPVLPTFPTPAPPAVPPGIEARFRALVKAIKNHAGYNVSIGEALDIEGAEHTGPDLATVQPSFRLEISGNHVFVDWGWQGLSAYLSMIEIQVDRGTGAGFVPLAFDTTPGYTDTAPFPTPPAKWTYRAIYRVGDAQVGLWSNLVSVVVGG